MKPITFLALCVVVTSAHAQSDSLTSPVLSDPQVVDGGFPPSMMELNFESEGERLNGLMYAANGPGPHPVVLLLHGLPGNEKNLDLAQALRRSGVNVVFFHYRGSWGSGGTFSFNNSLEDVASVLAAVRDSSWAADHRTDPGNVGIVGHSFGSFLGAKTAQDDENVACFANLDGWDVGSFAKSISEDDELYDRVIASWEEGQFGEGGPLKGTVRDVVSEIAENAESFSFQGMASELARIPLLIISASRAFGAAHDSLVTSLREAGAENLTEHVLDDDHSFSAHRIELAQLLVEWQRESCWP
jgi:pimeloyl-ACP methyl ester carboxylesterase